MTAIELTPIVSVSDWDASIAWFEKLGEGIEITREPVDEVWGVREFHVRHPDGHIFRIGTGTGDEERASGRAEDLAVQDREPAVVGG
jgi:hypothetical protein